MSKYENLIIEVKQFPESQEVMDNPDWFMIASLETDDTVIGDSAYARVLDESEYILVEKTTADEFNVMEELDNLTSLKVSESEESEVGLQYISNRDPGDEND